ncbi:LOW QUALITY PROTEIN: leucine-rich repeat-containing protein 3B [Sardina pilchardus]|uniref:LOW QUALITY PROTEIN: leucine-rich repeat-containing protein 3B n=1 Tax=Sardina pilchardus TaxID=27697 RepID=UPI002E11914A
MCVVDMWRSHSVPVCVCVLLQSLVLMALCSPSASLCPKGCSCLRTDTHNTHLRTDAHAHTHTHTPHGLNVTCSRSRLKEIPRDLPAETVLLRLDHNHISAIPERAFAGLRLLRELNLSGNALETLGESAFSGLEASLQLLDLSHNRISSVHKDAFSRLLGSARIVVEDNPWHCDCALQQQQALVGVGMAMATHNNNHEAATSTTRVLCRSTEPRDHDGQPYMAVDAELCNLAKRTTDYAMLVTMFGWFAMVISYVVYYVRQNQEDARRHLEYLKSLPSKPKRPDDPEDITTVV